VSCCSIRIVRIAEVIVCTLAREGCRGLLNDQYIYSIGPSADQGRATLGPNCKFTISKTKTVFFK
jgi:hypothetical protein